MPMAKPSTSRASGNPSCEGTRDSCSYGLDTYFGLYPIGIIISLEAALMRTEFLSLRFRTELNQPAGALWKLLAIEVPL